MKILMPLEQQEIPRGKWFCCSDCSRIHSTLQKLLIRGVDKLPDSFLDVIKKKYVEKGLDADINIDVRWRLLSGKFASPETRLLLSQAVGIFHVSLVHVVFRCFTLWPVVVAADDKQFPCNVFPVIIAIIYVYFQVFIGKVCFLGWMCCMETSVAL